MGVLLGAEVIESIVEVGVVDICAGDGEDGEDADGDEDHHQPIVRFGDSVSRKRW